MGLRLEAVWFLVQSSHIVSWVTQSCWNEERNGEIAT